MEQSTDISFSCTVSGKPPPTITWLKDGQPLLDKRVSQREISGFAEFQDSAINSTLFLSVLTEQDSGRYTCRANNELGQTDMKVAYNLVVKSTGT